MASSGPITSWEIDRETVETVLNFIFLGSKITADGDCNHEIKRCLLLGRKIMTNLDSILKSRDITLPTNVCLVKAVAQTVKHLPTMQQTRVQSLGREDLLEKAMAPHSSTLAWKILWAPGPGRGSQSGTRLSDVPSSTSRGFTAHLPVACFRTSFRPANVPPLFTCSSVGEHLACLELLGCYQ